MKNIKKITALALAFVMCLALASCNIAQNVEIKEDGTATVTAKMTISETEINKIETEFGLDEYTGEDGETASFDEFMADSDKAGLTETIDGVKYYSSVETAEYKNIDELNDEISSAGEYTTTEFWAYGENDTDSFAYYEQMFKEMDMEFTVELFVKLPYKIVKTNGEQVDDYTVKFGQDATITYAITEKSTAAWAQSADPESAIKDMAKAYYTPERVTGLKVEYKNSKALKLSWNECESVYVTGYQIQKRFGSGKWINVKVVKADNYNYYDDMGNVFCYDKNISSNKQYSYRVRAYYKNSDFTAYGYVSATKTFKTADLIRKPVVKLTAGKKKITLKVTNKDANCAGYEIKYATNSKFKKAKTTSVSVKNLPKTIKNLKSGTKYYVKVRKYCKGADGKVYGKWSKTVAVKVK